MKTRQQMIDEAHRKRQAADKAHRAGDTKTRNAFLRQAADRYREAGQYGMAVWCERWIGN